MGAKFPHNDRLLTSKEVGEYLCVSESTVHRLMQSGVLTSLKIGRSRRVSTQALTNYVAQLERQRIVEFRES